MMLVPVPLRRIRKAQHWGQHQEEGFLQAKTGEPRESTLDENRHARPMVAGFICSPVCGGRLAADDRVPWQVAHHGPARPLFFFLEHPYSIDCCAAQTDRAVCPLDSLDVGRRRLAYRWKDG